ncbi:MAG: E3 ubiquitin protein ligase [Candidatus Heimdallarchaeota archaeon]|nr:E3 ubiquitin protein ligase [Candidatus Heimdallarchaeota archaeon]
MVLDKKQMSPPKTSGDEVLLPIMLFLFIVIIIDILIIINKRNEPLYLIITIGILGLLISVNSVIITALIIKRKNKKKRYKIPNFNDEGLPSISEKDMDRYIGYEKESNLLRPKIVMRSSIIEAAFIQSDFIYSGEIDNKHCIICRIKLDKDDAIWKCPYCIALFHKQHFIDWVTEKGKCPVCRGKITILT